MVCDITDIDMLGERLSKTIISVVLVSFVLPVALYVRFTLPDKLVAKDRIELFE